MADDQAFIGYRSAGRRRPELNDRRASADVPVALARGALSGVLGAPGDLESLVRMLPGLSEQTVLPTSEDVERRLPLRSASETPVGRAATSLSQLAGGFYTGPGSPLRALGALPSAVRQAGRDFAMAAGQPAVNVVKPKGGNWLAGTVERTIDPMRTLDPNMVNTLRNADPRFVDQAGGIVKAAKMAAKGIGELAEKYTPEFKQWFSGSKAATPEGEPLTVYRGTTKDEGEIIKNGWFAKDPKAASMFSMKREKIEDFPNSVVTPAHLKMKNPLVVDAQGAYWDKIPFGDPRDKLFMSSDKIAQFAKDEKYDGVIFKNINESDDFFDLEPTDVFVTFNPNQAKSVFNKKPTSDPRVGYAAGGLVANSPTVDFDPARIDAIVGELHAMNAV